MTDWSLTLSGPSLFRTISSLFIMLRLHWLFFLCSETSNSFSSLGFPSFPCSCHRRLLLILKESSADHAVYNGLPQALFHHLSSAHEVIICHRSCWLSFKTHPQLEQPAPALLRSPWSEITSTCRLVYRSIFWNRLAPPLLPLSSSPFILSR